jgi:hypothetical protein
VLQAQVLTDEGLALEEALAGLVDAHGCAVGLGEQGGDQDADPGRGKVPDQLQKLADRITLAAAIQQRPLWTPPPACYGRTWAADAAG